LVSHFGEPPLGFLIAPAGLFPAREFLLLLVRLSTFLVSLFVVLVQDGSAERSGALGNSCPDCATTKKRLTMFNVD